MITYKNHALDQCLEDLIKAGMDKGSIVRLGSKAKCTTATAPLLLSEQKHNFSRSHETWKVIYKRKAEAKILKGELDFMLNDYLRFNISWKHIKEYLEFSDKERHFYEAFQVPSSDEGWRRAGGKKSKELREDYLYERWRRGENRGALENVHE